MQRQYAKSDSSRGVQEQNMDSSCKEECMRSIHVDWLNEYLLNRYNNEGNQLSKWRVSHDVGEEENAVAEKTVDWEFLVLKGSRWKQLFRVRWSEEKARYGLFASTRFEKGSVITAVVSTETTNAIDLSTTVPTQSNLGIGGKWATRVDKEDAGGFANAVMINGVIRAMIRILPDVEVVVLMNGNAKERKNSSVYRDNRMMLNFGLLDCIVYDPEKECGLENLARMGTVVEFGKIIGTFTIEYTDKKRTLFTEEEVEERLVKVPTAGIARGTKRKVKVEPK